MKIALIQMSSLKGETKKNLATMTDFVEWAAAEQADLVVFPEMNLTGYFASSKYSPSALTLEDKTVKAAIKLSEKYRLAIVFGLAEKRGEKFYISQLVVKNGEILGIYHKHNVINDEAKIFTPGKDLPVFQIDNIKIGLTICADIDRPELFKSYAEKGCQLVIECASPDLFGDRVNRNWSGGYNWWRQNCIEKIGQYARENKIMIAIATQSGHNCEDDFPGGGYLFSTTGEILSQTQDYHQGMLLVEI